MESHSTHDLQVCEDPSRSPNVNDPWARAEGWEGAIHLKPDVVTVRVSRVCVRQGNGARNSIGLSSCGLADSGLAGGRK